MKVNKKSWHYRYMMDLLRFSEPRTLCGYFWKLVFALFILPPLLIIASPVVLITLPLVVLREWLENKWDNRKYKQRKKKEPNVLMSYFKATKDKVCPIMEYE